MTPSFELLRGKINPLPPHLAAALAAAPEEQIRGVLQSFWDAGVAKVSPGALGVHLFGWPVLRRELELKIALYDWVRWEDPDWMVAG